MVFNITVLQKLQQAGVDLFEIVKNNNKYLLNSFDRMIVDCINAKNTAETKYKEYFQNVHNQWWNLREEYILSMVQEYKHELVASCAYDIREHIKFFTTDQILNKMFSDERLKLPWFECSEYYNRMLEIQCNFYKQFPYKEK